MSGSSSYWQRAPRARVNRRSLLRAGGALGIGGAGLAFFAACKGGSNKEQGQQAAPAQSAAAGGGAPLARSEKVVADEGPIPPWSKRVEWRVGDQPVRGQTMNFAGGEPVTLDTSQSLGSAPVRAISYIYDKLLTFRGDWWEDTALLPGLAESIEQPDAATMILHLRKNVSFHNVPPVGGRKFTSADVGWNIDYDKNKALIKHWGPTQKWSTPDEATVRIDLASPYSSLPTEMADVHNVMFPREVFDKEGNFAKTAIGTGPFVMDKYEPRIQIAWKRNPNYWQTGADGKPLPYLDAVIQYILPDTASIIAALESGRVSGGFGAGFYPADGEPLKQRKPNLPMLQGPWMNGLWTIFNLDRPRWKDDRVRKAATLAMDQQRIIDTVFQGKGFWQGGMPVAITEFSWSQDKLKQALKPDPQQARQLLQAAGAVGAEITSTGPYSADVEQVGQSMLNEAGFKASLKPQMAAEHYAALQSGDFDFFIYKIDWISADVDYWTYGSFHTGDPHNYSRVSDPRLDKLVEDQRKELDRDRRKKIVDDIMQYVLVEKAYIGGIPVHLAYHPQAATVKNMPLAHFSHENLGVLHAWNKG